MKHYGPEPPWYGRGRYGSWREGEEQWDGTTEWIWLPPGSTTIGILSDVLKNVYLDGLRESFSRPLLFLGQMDEVIDP